MRRLCGLRPARWTRWTRILAEGLLLAGWVLLATFSLRVGRPAASMAPPVWALALAMFGALTGHLVSRRWLWPAPGAAQPSPAPAPEPTSTPAETWQRDEAVEQGRGEERLRIAQDLHDDIGARLLTLMYQAPTPDMEDYIRHTLQDLKTLTRGLATPSHRLSDAAAEWKRDLSQRLALARCELVWDMQADQDMNLSMVQWSALTRILRELVSNAISHAQARQVSVSLILVERLLTLRVSDNGCGRAPEQWSHGLGLGGVRKRVKSLDGVVNWRELSPQGICCEVVVPHFTGHTGHTTPASGDTQAQRSH